MCYFANFALIFIYNMYAIIHKYTYFGELGVQHPNLRCII